MYSSVFHRKAVLLIFGLTLFALAHPTQAGVAGAFAKGKMHFAIFGGSGSAFNDSYTVIGGSFRYYLMDGLNLGIAAETWIGGNPDITKITPSIQYVFYQPSVVKPYIGGFYRRTYIESLDDLESVGGRAGVYIASGSNAFIGIGAVYESYLNCEEVVYTSCDDTYPEISFSFSF